MRGSACRSAPHPPPPPHCAASPSRPPPPAARAIVAASHDVAGDWEAGMTVGWPRRGRRGRETPHQAVKGVLEHAYDVLKMVAISGAHIRKKNTKGFVLGRGK